MANEDDAMLPVPDDDLVWARIEDIEDEEASADEPPTVTDAEKEEAKREFLEEYPVPKFDLKHRLNFEGLLYIGKISRNVKWAGHEFVIRTMKVDEILEVGQLHKPYVGTVSDVKAWQALTLAAVVETVDSQPIAFPIGEGQSMIESKFHYIRSNWYPWTLDKLYEQYLVLDAQVTEVINARGEA